MPSFLLPAGLGVPEIVERLTVLGPVAAGRAVTRRVRFLDSFDWRLHRAGWSLECRGEGAHARLLLLPLGGGTPVAHHAGPAVRFASELPAGELSERIAAVLGPRALLPLVDAETTVTPIALLDAAGRTWTRIVHEATLVAPPDAPPSLPLRPVLTVPDAARAAPVSALCAAWPDCEPAPADRVAALLEPLGRQPRDYTGKMKVALACTLTSGAAARALLLHLLGTIETNLAGVRDDIDPEFLHDFRVAVRRTRSAIGQLKGVLPAATAVRFAREFRWLQEASGPARDLNVSVIELPALGALLPARVRPSLGPLARLLARRRREAHAALVDALATPRFDRLLAAWRAVLLRPAPRRSTAAPNTHRPCADLAAERLRKLHRRALREGAAIGALSPAADLHELRKTCKKLRYLVEFFQSFLDREAAEAAVATLKGLQDTLGRFQDLHVQAAALLGHSRDLAKEGKAPPPAYVALGMLIERLRDEQIWTRQEFAERFGGFSGKESRRNWKRLIASAAAAGTPPAPAATPGVQEAQRG